MPRPSSPLTCAVALVALAGCARAPHRAIDATRSSEPANVVVEPRKPVLEDHGQFPCSECHDASLPLDPKERVLTEAHEDIALKHGAGRLWCTTCHHGVERDRLRGAKGEPIDFDASYQLCGQCHFDNEREFMRGAHGKRVGNLDATPRKVQACTSCHDAHDPSIKPRQPWRSSYGRR